MTAIAELGSFLAREQAAAGPIPPPAATANGSAVSSRTGGLVRLPGPNPTTSTAYIEETRHETKNL